MCGGGKGERKMFVECVHLLVLSCKSERLVVVVQNYKAGEEETGFL